MDLPLNNIAHKHHFALQIAAPSIARSFPIANDPTKSDSARAAAATHIAETVELVK